MSVGRFSDVQSSINWVSREGDGLLRILLLLLWYATVSGWAEIASRLKYQPVIAGYFHLKKHNFGRLLMVKIIKWTHFRRDRIDPQ